MASIGGGSLAIEYRWVAMRHVLHLHAAQAYKKGNQNPGRSDPNSDEHFRIARKYKAKMTELEKAQPNLPRVVYPSAYAVAQKIPEYSDFQTLAAVYIPFPKDGKLCKACGKLHTKATIGDTCELVGHTPRGSYYNCPCGSTLIVKDIKPPKAA